MSRIEIDTTARVLRDHGWPEAPAVEAARQLVARRRAGTVTRQEVDAVLIDVHDEWSADAADRGERGHTIRPREVERITTALGW